MGCMSRGVLPERSVEPLRVGKSSQATSCLANFMRTSSLLSGLGRLSNGCRLCYDIDVVRGWMAEGKTTTGMARAAPCMVHGEASVHTSTWPQRVLTLRKLTARKVLTILPIRTFAFFLGKSDDS